MSKLLSKKLISTKEAAEHSGYHPDYIARMCRTGKMEGERVGRSWFTTHESLKTFSSSQESRKREIAASLTKSREIEYQAAKHRTQVVQPNLVPAAVRIPVMPADIRPAPRKLKVEEPHMRRLAVSQAVFAVAAVVALGGAHTFAASEGFERMGDALFALAEDTHTALVARVISADTAAATMVATHRVQADISFSAPVLVPVDIVETLEQGAQNMAQSLVIPAAPPRAGGAGAVPFPRTAYAPRIDIGAEALALQALYAKAIYGWVDFSPHIPELTLGAFMRAGEGIELAVATGIYNAPKAYDRGIYAFVDTQEKVRDSVLVLERSIGEKLGEGMYEGSVRFALVRRGLENEALGIFGNLAVYTQTQSVHIANAASLQVAAVGSVSGDLVSEKYVSPMATEEAINRMQGRAKQLYQGATVLTAAVTDGFETILDGEILKSLALPMERKGVIEAGIR